MSSHASLRYFIFVQFAIFSLYVVSSVVSLPPPPPSSSGPGVSALVTRKSGEARGQKGGGADKAAA